MDYKSTSSHYDSVSPLSKGETRDCVVRAVASAFEVPYDEAHAFVKEKFKREDRKGTYGTAHKLAKLKEAFGKTIVELGEKTDYLYQGHVQLLQRYRMHGVWKQGRYTTCTFIKKYPKGTYIVLVKNHAFTIKDGVIYGNYEDSKTRRRRIMEAFKIG